MYDGITVFPFSGGRSLVRDCTGIDTFAAVHLNRSAMEAGTAGNCAKERIGYFSSLLAS